MIPVIDAHIHLDSYKDEEREELLKSLHESGVQGLIAVSVNLDSCRRLLEWKQLDANRIFPAFGFHPEQPLPDKAEEEQMFRWIREHRDDMVAVGEVGLPYYMRTAAEAAGKRFDLAPYIALLDRFVRLASELGKPVVLHAVYDDAGIACDLLEKHGVERAHFHWFKGSGKTLQRMKERGWFVSFTPDIVYKAKTKSIVETYPLHLLMAETDGPWPFEGPFEGTRTHPKMIRDSIKELAMIKKITEEEAGKALLDNTRRFYKINRS